MDYLLGPTQSIPKTLEIIVSKALERVASRYYYMVTT